MNRTGIFFVILATAMWATVGIAVGLVPEQTLWSPDVLAFSRVALAGPLLMGLAMLTPRQSLAALRRLRPGTLVYFATACAVFQTCLFWAFPLIGVTATMFLTVCMRPLIATAWIRISRRDPVKLRDLLAVSLLMTGLILLSSEGSGGAGAEGWWIGVAICVIGAVSFVAMTFAARDLSATTPVLLATGCGLTLTAGLLLIYLLLATASGPLPLDRVSVDTQSLLLVLYLAIVPTACAFLCFNYGISRCDNAIGGLLAGIMQPTLTAVLAMWFLGEVLSGLQLAGCVALLGSTLALWSHGGKQQQRATATPAPIPRIVVGHHARNQREGDRSAKTDWSVRYASGGDVRCSHALRPALTWQSPALTIPPFRSIRPH